MKTIPNPIIHFQLVLIKRLGTKPYISKIESREPPKLKDIIDFLIVTEGFNYNEDSVLLLDPPDTFNIDRYREYMASLGKK